MPIAAPMKKRSLLPVLTVVFLASYGLMTALIVIQGNTIQQQHGFIQVLMTDSRELWAIKGKAVAEKAAQIQAHNRAQAPSTQAQTPSAQVGPSQVAPNQQQRTENAGKAARSHVQLPPVPASDLGDQRRVLITL
jgi:hypothetical protein